MADTDSIQVPRELAHRVNDGVEIVLFWNEDTNELIVSVSDERTGGYFELDAAPDEALDVFYHPYSYAAHRGIPYDDALLPSWALAARNSGDLAEVHESGRGDR
jgi:hypothetical protein